MAGEILIRIVFTLSDLSSRTVGVEFADFWHNHNHCFAKYHHEGFGVSGDLGNTFHGEIVQQLWDSLVRCNEPLETNGHTHNFLLMSSLWANCYWLYNQYNTPERRVEAK